MRSFTFPRSAGVLLHPTSLPGRLGIGDFGPEAYAFIDRLVEAKQTVWQVCPLGPTGYGDSPYQCLSAFAGNPLLISLEALADDGLLHADELLPLERGGPRIDFGRVIAEHTPLLRSAWERFLRRRDGALTHAFQQFSDANGEWLDDWVLFSVIKADRGGTPWNEWETPLRFREPAALEAVRRERGDELAFHRWVQFVFHRQWMSVRRYATSVGVRILGDLPIFAAYDSAEAWARPELFQFDDERRPLFVAGVPPDYFSPTGQLWGNPVYDWGEHQRTRFAWWISVVRARFHLFDYMRIDHFRGFQAYWRIAADRPTAEIGTWCEAPGRELFDAIHDELGPLPIIAEDLGYITPEVRDLIDHCGFPGMKVLQFAFDANDQSDHVPHNFDRDLVVYTGTHDNDTVRGWLAGATPSDAELARAYLEIDSDADAHWRFIRAAYASTARIAIVPVQDILGLGSEARMNVPGTTGGNWQWRMSPGALDDGETLRRLAGLVSVFGRSG